MRPVKPFRYRKGFLEILDQSLLPNEVRYFPIDKFEDLKEAITTLKIRGAPLIGIVALFGILLEARKMETKGSRGEEVKKRIKELATELLSLRPTAFNIFFLIRELLKDLDRSHEPVSYLEKKVRELYRKEIERSKKIRKKGIAALHGKRRPLTICNTGALAAPGFGTALGVIVEGYRRGTIEKVVVAETRPLLQGARLTTWELQRYGIPFVLTTDNSLALLMGRGEIDIVLVGADRIARNGDTANKIGTFQLAVLSRHFDIPFYVVAPLSTFDPSIDKGEEIPIEERGKEEVTHFSGKRVAPPGTDVLNYAFDVTPNDLIEGIITDLGIISPPTRSNIEKFLSKGGLLPYAKF